MEIKMKNENERATLGLTLECLVGDHGNYSF